MAKCRIRLELDHDRPGPERRRCSFMIKRSLRQVQGAGRWQRSRWNVKILKPKYQFQSEFASGKGDPNTHSLPSVLCPQYPANDSNWFFTGSKNIIIKSCWPTQQISVQHACLASNRGPLMDTQKAAYWCEPHRH